MNIQYKALCASLTAFLLVGCANVPHSSNAPSETKIAVGTACPEPPLIPKESLPIANLTSKDYTNFAKISKSYVLSVKLLQKENKELRTALEPYYSQTVVNHSLISHIVKKHNKIKSNNQQAKKKDTKKLRSNNLQGFYLK